MGHFYYLLIRSLLEGKQMLNIVRVKALLPRWVVLHLQYTSFEKKHVETVNMHMKHRMLIRWRHDISHQVESMERGENTWVLGWS